MLLFTEDVDEFVPQTLMTYMEKPFCNVSTEDLGLQTEEEKKQAEEKAEEMKGLLTFVKGDAGRPGSRRSSCPPELGSHPVCMTPMGMSFEMEKYMKRANPEFAFPVGRVLELNPEHEAVQAMQKAMTEDPEKAKDYAKLLCYQAQPDGGTAAGRPLCLHRAGVQTDEVILTGKEKSCFCRACDKNIPTEERREGCLVLHIFVYQWRHGERTPCPDFQRRSHDADRHCHLCDKRPGALHYRQAPGLNHPWLAWIPVASAWIGFSFPDQYRYVVNGENKSKRKVLLTLNIITTVLSLVMIACGIRNGGAGVDRRCRRHRRGGHGAGRDRGRW